MFYPKREGIMLCHPWEEKRFSRFPNTFFIQPKLNGERCWVDWMGEEPVLISSYGNEFKYLDRIKEELKRLRLAKVRYDGELYVHGWAREKIHSAVSRKANKNDDSEEMEFHIFDIKESVSQMARLAFLEAGRKEIEEGGEGRLKVVRPVLVRKDEWEELAIGLIEQGYEGAVLRDPDGVYEEKRSAGIIKFKPTEKDVYIIVGVEEEVSIHGVPKGSLGSFLVKSPDEELYFSVGTGPALTKEKREQYWKFRNALIGKRLVVKHEKLRTVNRKPIATVALEVIA